MAKVCDVVPGYEFDPETDLKAFPVWFQDIPHCVPPFTPMFAWFWINWIHHGQQYGAERLSLPTHKGLECRFMRGASYISATIIKDEHEIKRREVKFRDNLRPYIENFDALWKGYIDEMMSIYEPLKKLDLDAASTLELKQHLEDVISMCRRVWEIHFEVMYAVYTCFVLFEDMCSELLGIDDRSPEFQGLMKGFDNKAFQIDKRLWQFAQDARNKGLADIFETAEAKHVVSRLEQIEAGREWLKRFREFLWEDGWRMQRMAEITEPTWIEDPSAPIINIKHFLKKGGGFDLEEKRADATKERKKTAKALLERVPEEQRDWFQTLMSVAQKAGSWSEEHAHYLDLYSNALIRRCCLAIGKRFVQAGAMDRVNDIFFLIPDEVRMAIITPEFNDVRHIVSKRRQEWVEWCKGINPPMLGNVSPEEAMRFLITSKDPLILKIVVGRLPMPKPELKADLYGSGGSPGVAEGPARCISSYEQLAEIQPGEILVAPATTPSWTMVFGLIKGVVVASGGSLSHAAIVGREYGIPVVTNVYDGINKIKTGQRIRVNGNTGTVYFLES
jgi:phosphohistidine swiveling domain-containing protein